MTIIFLIPLGNTKYLSCKSCFKQIGVGSLSDNIDGGAQRPRTTMYEAIGVGNPPTMEEAQ